MAETVTFEDFETKPLPKQAEAGTPAFAEAIAFGEAVDYWSNLGMENIAAYEKELLAYATEKVSAIDRVRIIGTRTIKSRSCCSSSTVLSRTRSKKVWTKKASPFVRER
jgi:cysteine desulfurase/selenocysteine lyase